MHVPTSHTIIIDRLFFEKFFAGNDKVTMSEDARSDETLRELIEITDGMSGRGLEKLVISAQGKAFGNDVAILTKDMLLEVAKIKVEQFFQRKKMQMNKETAGNFV